MSHSSYSIFLVLFLFSSVFSQNINTKNVMVNFSFNSNEISTQSFNLPPNVVNPISVTISSGFTNVELCVQPNYYPYPNEFSYTCTTGSTSTSVSFVGQPNTTSSTNQETRKSFLNLDSESLQDVNTNVTSNIYVQSNADIYYATMVYNGGFGEITAVFTVNYCDNNQFGSDCSISPETLTMSGTNFLLSAGSWEYFMLPVQQYTGSINVSLSSNGTTNLLLYTQLGSIPDDVSHTSPYYFTASNVINATILSPYSNGKQWYVGVFNNDTSNTYNVSLFYSDIVCGNSSTFGSNCQNNWNSLSDVNVVAWNKTEISFGKQSNVLSTNMGLVLLTYNQTEFNDYVSVNDYGYFRFSIGPKSGVDALTAYARYNDFPSQSVFDYDGTMEHVTQFILQNPSSFGGNGTWFISVVASNDFYAWVGSNCYDCENHGHCVCNNQTCDNTTVFGYPTSTNDSFGMCNCDYSDYDQSFDCLVNPNAFSPIYIVLIVIGGAIVIAVAIGVPLYCYLRSRKRASYDTI